MGLRSARQQLLTLEYETRSSLSRRPLGLSIILFPAMVLLYILASPLVIAADIFTQARPAGRAWVLGYFGLVILVTVSAMSASWVVEEQLKEALTVVTRYSLLKGNLDDVPYRETIAFYSARADLDPALVAAVIQKESEFQPEAVSPAGARGLMQITPTTWRYLNPRSPCRGDHPPPAIPEHGDDCIYSPAGNIRTGVKYLRQLLDQFSGDVTLAFAAYNAGASSVIKYSDSGDGLPPFAETRAFVAGVLRLWPHFQTADNPTPRGTREFLLFKTLNRYLPMVSLGFWGLFLAWAIRKVNWH